MSLAVPDAVDAQAREGARDALDAAPVEGDTLALVFGGHDSLTATHVPYSDRRTDLDGIVHVNTGIGIDDTREFVRRRARELGLSFHEVGAYTGSQWSPSEYRYIGEEYAELVHEYGFPGPAAHRWMYLNLKEKPLQRWLNEHYPDREVTLVSGVRRHESENRMENVAEDGHQEFLGATTVSPLVEFTGLDVRRYRRGPDLPMNPVVETLEMSGECLCGAFADRGEMRMLELFYPDVHRRLLCLEASVSSAAQLDSGPDQKYARWGHNRLQEREQKVMDDNDQMLLCQSCEVQDSCETDDGCGGDA